MITVTLSTDEALELQASINVHILQLVQDVKRVELTDEGRARYAAMLRTATRARDKLEEGVLCE